MAARAQDLREAFSVSTLEDAMRWLWTHSDPQEWLWSGDLPAEAILVCDVFWITPSRLCDRMQRQFAEATATGVRAGRRRLRAVA